MTVTQIILLAIIGLLAGVFSGTFGVGGAIIVIPALIFFLGLSQHQAQGTSLAFMIPPVTLMAAIIYWKNGYVNWKFALVLAVMFFIGTYFGTMISISIPDKILKKMFGGLLMLVALKIIFSK
ncbi:MAG: sulfite exporter TauE/SafE family protein [Prolixibacteraceae bacterium]|nr:sulfite exporter TauE/SafE family protein [Prolixibacteraceae bacterium]